MNRPVGGARRRHHSERKRWVGRLFAEQRIESGLTQRQVAACAALDQAQVSRIETGRGNPSLDSLLSVSACVGAELSIRLFPSAGPRLRDRFQAPMIDALVREVGPAWRTSPELPVPAARGVVDLVLTRSLDRLAIACECHSELRRLEMVVRRLAEKTEALRAQMAGETAYSSLLLVRSTVATRLVAATYEATLAAAFPGRTADALAALRGTAAWPGPTIVWARVEKGRAEILAGPPRRIRVGR